MSYQQIFIQSLCIHKCYSFQIYFFHTHSIALLNFQSPTYYHMLQYFKYSNQIIIIFIQQMVKYIDLQCSDQQLVSLPQQVLNTCSICLNEIQQETLIKKCRHQYCYNCIQKWIQMGKRSCPICRRKFTAIMKIKPHDQEKSKRNKRKFKKSQEKKKYFEIKVQNIPMMKQIQQDIIPIPIFRPPIVYPTFNPYPFMNTSYFLNQNMMYPIYPYMPLSYP